MAEQDLIRLERELNTTEALQEDVYLRPIRVASMYRCNKLDSDRRWPYFRKNVMRGSLHYLPQSAICIPTAFMDEHPEIFQIGNFITLEGPSGNKWRVRASNRPILHCGWRAFAHDHGLREGDQLYFNLTKPSYFVVEVLNSDGDVKESALKATVTGKYAGNPNAPLQRTRKRKAGFRNGMAPATIASRCKTTARRGCYNDYPVGARLRYSEKTKQWECHEETDGREVVTILDSDDDEPRETRLLDNMELSFGSAQVQNYRSRKVQRLVAYVKEQGEYLPQWPNSPTQVEENLATQAEKPEFQFHQEIAGCREDDVVEQHENDPLMLERAGASELIGCKSTKTATVRKEKLNSSMNPLQCQAQASCEEDIMVKEEEGETHLKILEIAQPDDDLELEISLQNFLGADLEARVAISNSSPQSHTIPDINLVSPRVNILGISAPKNTLRLAMEEFPMTSSRIQETNADTSIAISCKNVFQSRKISTFQEAAAEQESREVAVLTNKAELPTFSSQVVLTSSSTAMAESLHEIERSPINACNTYQDKAQETEGDFLFETLQNIVEMPVMDTTNGGQKDSATHPFKQALSSSELAEEKNQDNQVEHEEHDRMLQSKDHKNCELPVTKIEPSYGYGYGASENAEAKETAQQSYNFLQTAMKADSETPDTDRPPQLRLERDTKIETKNQSAVEDLNCCIETFDAHGRDDIQFTPNPTSVKDELSLESSSSTTITCVLKSKRGPVLKLDREKALKAAQAWTKKLRHPNFIAVMKTTNVYTDFNMDIPAEFGKKSRLPVTEAKMTLVCDEVPTTSKAVWVGSNGRENPKLKPQGWMEFSRSHLLEEGDVCVFELFNRVTIRIGVHIFRVVGLTRSSLLDWTHHYYIVTPQLPTTCLDTTKLHTGSLSS